MRSPVSRCGRLDDHTPHTVITGARLLNGVIFPSRAYICEGPPVIEGGARCFGCSCVVCRCEEKAAAELARERHEEYWAE